MPYGNFYYGKTGFFFKKSGVIGARYNPSLSAICNQPQDVNNRYVPGSGVGASSTAQRRAKLNQAYRTVPQGCGKGPQRLGVFAQGGSNAYALNWGLYNCPYEVNNNSCSLLPQNTPYQLCSPWPQFGGLDNTNSRYTPILASQTGSLQLLYISQDLFQVNTSPVISNDGTIYIGFNYLNPGSYQPKRGVLFAFNKNGTIKWQYELPYYNDPASYDTFFLSTPTIGSNGTIYFGSNLGYVYAVNPDGTLQWVQYYNQLYPTPGTSSNISASFIIGYDKNIYFGSNTNDNNTVSHSSSLFSVNPNNGTINWQYNLSNLPGSISSNDYYIYDSVAIDNNNNVYFICQQTTTGYNKPYLVYLVSLDSKGNFRYICDLNNGNTDNMDTQGRPTLNVDNSIIYALSYSESGYIYLNSFNTADGSTATTQNLYVLGDFVPYNGSGNSIARDNNNNLYFSTNNSKNSFLISVKNNTFNWIYKISPQDLGYDSTLKGLIYETPAIGSDGTIYFGVLITNIFNFPQPSTFTSVYYMYAINPNGNLKWSKLVSNNAFYGVTSSVIDLQGNIIKFVSTFDITTSTPKFGSNLYSFS